MADLNYTIVIVDDERDICSNYLAFFEDQPDFHASAWMSAEEALKAFKTNECPDACIVDMRLPGMRGDMFISMAMTLCPECRFVVSTGSLGLALTSELVKAGLTKDDIFYKPTNMQDVLSRLRTLLETKKD